MEEAIAVSDKASDRVVCCSVRTYMLSNVLWGLICLALLSLATFGAVSPSGVFLVFPQEAYLILVGISTFGLLLCFMGIWGSTRNNECCVLCFICLVAIGLIVQVLLFAFILLYINDVPTFNGLDQSALSVQEALEKFLVDYSQRESAAWKEAQDQLKCCGVTFASGCDVGITLSDLESGALCLEGSNEANLTTLRLAECPTPDVANIEASQFGSSNSFFCIDSIGAFLKENTPIIGAILGVVLLAQVASLVAALRLYWVPKDKGGFSEPFNDKYGVAKPKTAEEYGGGLTGQAKAFTNRLSYRLNRATYQEGTQGGSIAGNIKNRLSYRGPPPGQAQNKFVSQMGPEPTGGGPPPMGGPPPSMFNRLSRRLGGFAGFGRGPPGPPPPPGAGSGMMNQGPGGPGPMGAPPPRPPNAFKRMSARVQQGFNQFRLPFGGGRGPPPPTGQSGYVGGPPRGGMGGPPPPRGGMGGMGGPPPPRGGMGGPPRGGFGGPPRGGMGGPPRGGMGGPPRGGMGGPPRGGMGGPPRGGMGGPPRGGMGGPPGGFGGPPRGGFGGPPRGGMGGPPPPRGGMGGPPRGGFGGPPRGGMGGPPRGGFGGPPRGGMGGPPPQRGGSRGGQGRRRGAPPPRPSGGGRGRGGGGGGGGGGAPGGLLAQIQGGARLKPTHTNDRSGPMI